MTFHSKYLDFLSSSSFYIDLIGIFLIYGLYIYLGFKEKRKRESEIYKMVNERNVISNLSNDLRTMTFRLTHNLVQENINVYNWMYSKYPDIMERHSWECKVNKKQIDQMIEDAAKMENKSIEDIKSYLKNFIYLDTYFKS